MTVTSIALGELGANCFVVSSADQAVVIDPGGDPAQVSGYLRDNSLTPILVMATHGHFDHVGGVAALVREWSIPFAASSLDLQLLAAATEQAALFGCAGVESPPDIDIDLNGLEALKRGPFELQIYPTPGHSPGSVTIRAEDELFVGDVLFQDSIGRTDLPGGSYETLITSIRETLLPIVDGVVYPGHGPSTTISRERDHNPFLR